MDILLSQYSNNLFRLPVRVLSALVLSLENRLVLLNAKTPVTVTEVLHYSPKEFLLDKEPFRYRKTLSKTVYGKMLCEAVTMVTVIGKLNFTLLTFTELIFVRKPCHILLAGKNS